MIPLCDITRKTSMLPMPPCSDFVQQTKTISLTCMEQFIIKEQFAVYGFGYIFRNGGIIQIKKPEFLTSGSS